MPLPASRQGQIYCYVEALSAGHLTLPEHLFISPCPPNSRKTVPSLSFLITHPTSNLLFDLGLRNPQTAYASSIRTHIETRQPLTTTPDVIESLASLSLAPKDIATIILSHIHWDHIGTPSQFPAPSQFVVGPGALALLGTGGGTTGGHSHFEPGLLPADRTLEITEFPEDIGVSNDTLKAKDWFGDGSLYVVDAPGHLQGHINLLVRTEGGWVYLAGDAAHDRRLLMGVKEVAVWENGGCIHSDKEMAVKTIAKIRKLRDLGVEVILAHDKEWEEQNRERIRPEWILAHE
ncbi:beta-lactamase-like protein [Pyronema domesticum]|uniref:Similar to 4-pyridoxolactonase acc. no. Q988B9 n=1 Tax=Pyronema omphalodes (strain CBS 100304) TaxID=1076935 RepID=U4LW96_PYROM|nr:beta-lactamase-like protein [Pyronema domesticum]CCX33411.1 Similar to 4-pyridoxolactonase; acc. no. Q988B9 [Pyronema omphalodes CBS 100304]